MLPVLAAMRDGDMNADDRLDFADVLLLQRISSGDLVDPNAVDFGDVAPLESCLTTGKNRPACYTASFTNKKHYS